MNISTSKWSKPIFFRDLGRRIFEDYCHKSLQKQNKLLVHTLIFTDIALLCSIGSSSEMVSVLCVRMATNTLWIYVLPVPNYRVSIFFSSQASLSTALHQDTSLGVVPRSSWLPVGAGNTSATSILWTEVVKGAVQGQKIAEDWVMIPLWECLISVTLPTLLVFADFTLIFSGTARRRFSDYLTLFPGAQVSYIQNTKEWKLKTLCQLSIYIYILKKNTHSWVCINELYP